MARRIDLNVDIGEGFPFDEALLQFATSANVCCGAHAGSRELTHATIDLCRRHGKRIGMHPGFDNRAEFGRVIPDAPSSTLSRTLLGQAQEFMEIFPAAYIKPHGAWYNAIVGSQAPGRFDPSRPLFQIVRMYKIPAMLLAGYRGLTDKWLIREGFADRGYQADGTLIPRSQPGAVLHDPDAVAAQVVRLAPSIDSICLHGDTAGCVEFAELVHRTLIDAGFEVGF